MDPNSLCNRATKTEANWSEVRGHHDEPAELQQEELSSKSTEIHSPIKTMETFLVFKQLVRRGNKDKKHSLLLFSF